MLVTIVLIGILVSIMLTGNFGLGGAGAARPDNVGETIIGRSAARAKDEVCRNNISQLRMAIRIQHDTDETYPQNLSDISGFPASMLKCPIQPHESYQYDSASGQVTCPHPGHERY
jgi:hypothetical protein